MITNAVITKTNLNGEIGSIAVVYSREENGNYVSYQTSFGLSVDSDSIKCVLSLAAANAWEDLVDRVIRIDIEDNTIKSIGHAIHEIWLDCEVAEEVPNEINDND